MVGDVYVFELGQFWAHGGIVEIDGGGGVGWWRGVGFGFVLSGCVGGWTDGFIVCLVVGGLVGAVCLCGVVCVYRFFFFVFLMVGEEAVV